MRAFRKGSWTAVLMTALVSAFMAAALTSTATGAPVISGKHYGKLKNAPKVTGKATFTARGSIEQAYVEGATPGIKLLMVNKQNGIVSSGKADKFGSKVFYGQKPLPGFRVFSVQGKKVLATKPFKVLSAGDNPANSFYANKAPLHEGLNYVTMRDGTELAMTVRLPSGKDIEDGPFPTFVEYSGYQTAAPHDAFASFLTGQHDGLAPATSTAVGSIVGPLLDFAVVSVQMRGTGCSGGAFDVFSKATTYDGYDAIETVGNQPWVKGGKVGMGGISFSGITQIFTAGTQPPHLAAISPMSVTDDAYLSSVYPGGIFNDGFQLNWLKERQEDALPAPEGGQEWAKILTTTGDPALSNPAIPDQHCIDNQKMHLQAQNGVAQTLKRPFRNSVFADRSPGSWVSRIKVPVFWIGNFEDEQTSSHFADSLSKLKNNKNVWITLQNGVHCDSLGPSSITRWVEFMNLFVADRIPVVPPLILSQSATLYHSLANAAALPVEQSRFANYTDVDQARAEFKKDPRVRILMDNGAAIDGTPGAIGAKWEMDYNAWPPKEAKATPYYFGAKGALTTAKPKKSKQASYKSDPKARPSGTLDHVDNPGAEAWFAQPDYKWAPIAKGKGLGFTGPVLKKDTVIAGTSSVDLWLKSTAKDTDLQATLSEVRPDGQETYVQSGWLRASHRKIDKKLSTVSAPFQTHYKKDAAPLPKGKFSLVRIPVYPASHAFRAGSKIRITIEAAGGDRAIWHFATHDKGQKNTIILGGKKASRLVLPVLAGATAKGNPLPPATALRGEPNRTYETASNGG